MTPAPPATAGAGPPGDGTEARPPLTEASDPIAPDDLRLMRRWFGWRDAPHALRRHFNEVAFAQLREREREVGTLRSAADWRRRQAEVRDTLGALFGPFPERTPLNARVTGVLRRPGYQRYPGYRVEKIVFESRPGMFVTGCLFVPDGLSGPAPAILNPIGHTDIAFRGETYQRLILHLVRRGFIVFPFDPVGQGERVQYFDPRLGASRVGRSSQEHTHFGRQILLTGRSSGHYFAWDGIRAIDYLLSRPEVDPRRIGVTGLSGGGTQTAYIAALDERVAAAAPACYICGFGRLLDSVAAQDAEQNPFGAIAAGIDHADFLEVRAPRPTLVVATTRDFFSIQGAREVCAEAVRAFSALGAPEGLEQVEDDHGHGYTAYTRAAIGAFFHRALGLPGDPRAPSGPHAVAEERDELIDPADLTVTDTGQVSTSLGGETVFSLHRAAAVRLLEGLDARRRDLPAHLPAVRAAAVRRATYVAPQEPPQAAEAVFAGRLRHPDCAVEKVMLSGGGPTLTPALVLVPYAAPAGARGSGRDGGGPGRAGRRPGALVLLPQGKGAALDPHGVALALVRRGWIVLAPDLSGRGELEHETRYYEPSLIGRSVPGVHAAEIARAARYLAGREDVLPAPLQLEGRPAGGGPADGGVAGAESAGDATVCAVAVGALGAALLHAAALQGQGVAGVARSGPDRPGHEARDARGAPIGPVALLEAPLCWAGMALHREYATDFSSVVPGALGDYDLPDLAACLAPGHLLVVDPVDHLDRPASEASVAAEWEVVRRAYGGAGGRLTLRAGVAAGAETVAEWLTSLAPAGGALVGSASVGDAPEGTLVGSGGS